jgi:hypothetical protein
MIIGINGYSGSGKDAVGKIIQNLTAFPNDSVDSIVKMIEQDYSSNGQWQIKKWAGKLKVVAAMLTGIPVEKFEDQEFKKTNLGPQWSYLGPSCDGGKTRFSTADLVEKQMTVRDFLQKLGTDSIRDGLHTNAWVNALMSDYIGMYDLDTDKTTYPNWVITDTRFPNEAEAIKKANGIIIRVERPGVKPINNHPSEVSLDNWNFDHTIINDSSVEALAEKVKQILQFYKIIS